MARRLTNFDFNAPAEKPDHPFAKYLDGNIWRLNEDDFDGKTAKSVKHSIDILARKRGFRLEFKFLGQDKDVLVVRATKKEEDI